MSSEWMKKFWPKGGKPAPGALLAFAGALGLFLMIAGSGSGRTKQTQPPPETGDMSSYAALLEEKLTRVIGSIDGAGRVQVSVTLEAGEETVYAQDERSDGPDRATEKKHILMNGQGKQEPLVEMVWAPEVRGIAVVCQGAGDPGLEAQILETVSVLTGVSTNRISIAKMR